ncbi:MAG TPA: trehalase family glycosidase [Candidatus Saccharimonadales bacterium]|nr:trehalase family glycosidase [Candidatus Saccharimonadales bacterium]
MVLLKAINLTKKIPLLPRFNQPTLTPEEVRPAREYIAAYWPKLTRYNPKDTDSLVGLPKPYLVPAYEEGHEFDFNELYYWDSYFMVQGLLDEQHKELVLGILEDLLSEFKRFRIIPNASRTYLMGRSHPPFLTSLILDTYHTFKMDRQWLGEAMAIAEEEYQAVWMGTEKPHARQVYEDLSRYYDINYLNDLAETESGWDLTPRFGRHCLDFLPVDLNSLLYKYESDFAYVQRLLGDETKAAGWDQAAQRRRNKINELMWSNLRNFYYDYNYVKKQRGNVDSLAAYYTMWAGLVDERQATRLVSALRKFENRGGLAATDTVQLAQFVPGSLPTQWAYPNGWAPLHFIVVKGLQRYGYNEDARRIALKWLRTNLDWFKTHGVFLEKYNVVQPSKPPLKGVYPSQTGFGWTNAVFERFCQEFIDRP